MNEDKPTKDNIEETQSKQEKPINQALSSEMDDLLKVPTVLDDSELTTEVNPDTKTTEKTEKVEADKPADKPSDKKPATKEKTKKPLRKYILPAILGVVLLVISVLCILIVICLNTNTKPVFGLITPAEEAAKACITDKVAFDELTKESAYDWLNILYHDKNCAVDNLLNDDDFVLDNPELDSFRILYSYSNDSEIQKLANNDPLLNSDSEKHDIEFDLLKKENYYIVRDNSRKSCNNDACYVGIIFNKNYANHYQEDKVDQSGAHNINDRTFITNFDKDWIKTVLDILNSESFLQSVYESSIEFDGTNYIYTTHNVGVGVDMNNMDQFYETHEVPYAINLYETKTIVDPSGTITNLKIASDGGYMNVLATFPLTTEEAKTLMDDTSETNNN